MKADRPSRTARFVALGRALADAGLSHVLDFHDPTARVFLNEKGTRTLAKAERVVRERKRGIGLDMARAMADMIALRTAAIDTAVRDAIAGGATQLVILGAGYDGRAWRMLELAGVKADPLAAAAYLRLLADGRSRLEAVVVSDVNGSIASRTEVGTFARTPWAVKSTPTGPELCFDVAGKWKCDQVERDLASNDLLLYDPARPRGHADLRLHRVASRPRPVGTD